MRVFSIVAFNVTLKEQTIFRLKKGYIFKQQVWEDTLANGETSPAPVVDLKNSEYERECRRKLRVTRRLHELEDSQLPPPVTKVRSNILKVLLEIFHNLL